MAALRLSVGFLLTALLLTGCRPDRSFRVDPSESTAAARVSAGPASVNPTGGPAACDLQVGSQLRERATVGADGGLQLTAGALSCRGVGVWAGRFNLNGDPTADPAPTFVGTYTGGAPMNVRLPAPETPCAATAVYFTISAKGGEDQAEQRATAVSARAELRGWPADTTSTVPSGAILKGRSSVLLYGSVTGDPSVCTAGERVSTPVAQIGDCWLDTAAAAGTPAATATAISDTSTPFRKVSCDGQHTHEVYWVEPLDDARYAADYTRTKVSTAVWARQRANTVCAARSGSIALTHDVSPKDITLESQWPSSLTWPPTASAPWTRAQLVCLARWRDGKPSDRHLLHR